MERRPLGSTQSVSSATSSSLTTSTPGGGSAKFGTFFLGRYRVVDEIGIGGMASVHLARADGPGGFQKWVAIKRIHPHLVEDDQFIHMFLDEARIAARISHANVAQVFDLGEGDGTYWISMEYLHGEPLREVMRCVEEGAPRMPTELAAKVVADSAEGLHAAHDLRGKNGELLGLVHRDVTPHNLFVTYDGNVKVVDFGIAKVAGRLSSTRAGTLKGKLAYMSPEQVRGGEVDRRTDIFALGVVLWELTTGHRLFRMESDLETLEKVQACIVPPPSTIVADYPVELESIVMKALAKSPDARYQTARELARALQQHMLRRGLFVGPEDVASYVRRIFHDRIKKRDAHLRWAAEVTQTINVEEFRAQLGVRSGGEASASSISMQSYESEVAPGPVRPAAGAPAPAPARREIVTSRPPALARPTPPVARPQSGAVQPPRPAAGKPPALVQGETSPEGFRRPGELPAFGGADRPMASYDDDDDEDVATVVASAKQMLPEGFYRPAPSSGTPSNVSVAPSLTPASPGFEPLQRPAPPMPAATLQGYGPPPSPPAMPYGAPLQQPVPPRAVDPRLAAPTVHIGDSQRARGTGPLVAILAVAAVITALGVVALVVLRVRSGDNGPAASASAQPLEASDRGAATGSDPAPAGTPPPTPATASAGPPTISLSALPPSGDKVPPPAPPTTTTTTKKDPKDKDKDPPSTGGDNGFLTVVCNPFCDSVIAAGKNLGPSPVLKVPLPPGQHRVTLRKSGSPPKVMSVVIVSGQTSPLRVKMD